MKRTSLTDHPCSIARTLDVAGEWWSPLILRDVAYGVQRFGAIQEDLGISANVLSDRLDTLVAEGLLQRSAYQQRPERHEYTLTEKGADLIPALLALMQWGDRWQWPDGRGPVRVLHESCGHDVHVEVRCVHCEREAATGELRAKARGGVVEAPAEHQPGGVSARRLLASAQGVALGARDDGA
ncbi:MAG TPA: helix-turn-helix domain-containing protein [Solirubrobacteraceae bacterium]|jgi:DNA-binding HxlR family transcriptional regulator|nr:helix-turn-helix domain-containing protein [Solirubrobacteraceae bacterium]